MALNKPRFYQIKVTLLDCRPPIWRRLTLSSDTTLEQLHSIIQIAMGWLDVHLHVFKARNGALYGPPDADDPMGVKDERNTTLGKVLLKPKHTLLYEYDFGDGWEHEILLEKSLPMVGEVPMPTCTKAVGACPPEDVGGPPGYAHLLEVLRDPSNPEYEDMLEWVGDEPLDPDYVELEEINNELLAFDAEDEEVSPLLEELVDEIRETLAAEGIDSEEAVQEAVARVLNQKTERPMDEFHGLSPDRMHGLLYQTFDASWVHWSEPRPPVEQSPILQILAPLLDELYRQDIKLTPKGNLPLSVVKAMMAEAGPEVLGEGAMLNMKGIRSEEDVNVVHITRVLAQITDLVDTRKTKMVLNAKGRAYRSEENRGALYLDLFKHMLRDFNWAYVGATEEATGIQTTGPFLFWLLNRYGDQWRASDFYEQAHLEAFPVLVEEVEPLPYMSREDIVKSLIRWRALKLFYWFGLIEQRPVEPASDKPALPEYEIRATPLLRELVHWS